MSKISAPSQRPSCQGLDEHHEHVDHSSADHSGLVSFSGAQGQLSLKRKRNQLRTSPDPDTEVVALSPESLMATNRFVCERCGKGFPRDQNLQLHLRQHNLPWKLNTQQVQHVDSAGSNSILQLSSNINMVQSRKRVYICPEESCVHHHWSRALGDLTGIKKHFSRKHGERKWKCDKCWKTYAVHSDWKAHTKICGNREFLCDSCGLSFTRKDKFSKHRDYCKALAQEMAKVTANVEGERISDGTAGALGGSPLISDCSSSASGQQLTPSSSVEGISNISCTPPSLHINVRPTAAYELVQKAISGKGPIPTTMPKSVISSAWIDVEQLHDEQSNASAGSGGIESTSCALSLWPIGIRKSNDAEQQLGQFKRAPAIRRNLQAGPASSWGLCLPVDVNEPGSNTAMVLESCNSTIKPWFLSSNSGREMNDPELNSLELDACGFPNQEGVQLPYSSALAQLVPSSRGLQGPHVFQELEGTSHTGNLSSPFLSMLTDPYLLYTPEKDIGLKDRVTRDFLGVGG